MTNRLRIAIFNTRRYSNIEVARDAAATQDYWVPVLLGDDGLFWVPSTNREAGMLRNAGYEVAAS